MELSVSLGASQKVNRALTSRKTQQMTNHASIRLQKVGQGRAKEEGLVVRCSSLQISLSL